LIIINRSNHLRFLKLQTFAGNEKENQDPSIIRAYFFNHFIRFLSRQLSIRYPNIRYPRAVSSIHFPSILMRSKIYSEPFAQRCRPQPDPFYRRPKRVINFSSFRPPAARKCSFPVSGWAYTQFRMERTGGSAVLKHRFGSRNRWLILISHLSIRPCKQVIKDIKGSLRKCFKEDGKDA